MLTRGLRDQRTEQSTSINSINTFNYTCIDFTDTMVAQTIFDSISSIASNDQIAAIGPGRLIMIFGFIIIIIGLVIIVFARKN